MNRLTTIIISVCFSLPALADTTAIGGGKVHTVGPEGTIDNAIIVA